MRATKDVYIYFNFRSPYCYLASRCMFDVLDQAASMVVWRPFAGWRGRTPRDHPRQKDKVRIARQDLARITAKRGYPFVPPPAECDATLPALGSLYAEKQGLLRPYVETVMSKEWGEGVDVGQEDILAELAVSVGLDREGFVAALHDDEGLRQLEDNWQEAVDKGVIGVPTFMVDDQIFWGQDRLSWLREYLEQQADRRLP
ncbi:2-hydroxychromene-2-carboxylate isomerase [Emcibacter nanhaiensis]|uniref:2-hydroxychromene-2-carboxylate isomerase n=1 Tax=Emcibacter nanhaiensis TaxID=1505037 RepID=A0A501PEP6_9PROT|nr:DsbA family protein [Emcibacter nanhaiensis]TPD58893.1 2-hydroxychromene-2-carboxylate isomerase [Emcibacter nanhaiensis]